ncbi:MAG: DNA-processing protein DprA [Chloroflexota bacterium]
MHPYTYWLGFSLIRNLGPKRTLHLANHFTGLESAWRASEAQLIASGLSAQFAADVVRQRNEIDLEHEVRRVEAVRARIIPQSAMDYPPLLKPLPDAPTLLYVRGSLLPGDSRAVCIVGTRKATVYGKDAAYRLAYDLASQGVTIVSGLAHGIDSAAHNGALDAGGRTLAISGCGISEIYPSDNLDLAHRIIEHGAVITEFPIGTPPTAKNFPRRNRIMSGMTLGVLVAEAGEKSGSLITAGLAAEQGRDVFAVPSNIFSQVGRGTNRLIQDGAKLVMSAADVLDEIDTAHEFAETALKTERVAPESDVEQHVLDMLGPDPVHVDDLARLSDLPISQITATLTLLELKGLAQSTGPMQYIRSR